jgi:Carboxypeptidase regulatory-like domain
MRFFRVQSAVLGLCFLAIAGFVASTTSPLAHAQSAVTGAISGTVSDATGAVVPNATVVVVDTATDAKLTVKTNGEGRYAVGLLKPDLYKITASAESLKSDTLELNVILGTTVEGDIKVTPTGSNTVVEVTSTGLPLVDTQNIALATTFTSEQIQELPTPGGDVTTVAFTAPGVVVNNGGAYGNFSSDGLPGVSNLFVLNGFDNQDPFLNLNNSGSSNLTLGQGELAEATVIQNAYNSQYGRAAGAIIQYTTKSGTNRFHGEGDYNYNGSVLNANGWFNKHDELEGGDPNIAPHAVSNEWALNGGGPIIRDHLFFFSDYEGLHYVLPSSSGFVTFPSPALSTYILGNVPAGAQAVYGLALNDYTKSPAYKSAIPVANGSAGNQDANGNLGCGSSAVVPKTGGLTLGGLAGTPAPGGGVFGVSVPCMVVGTASVNNVNIEWLYTQRIDWNISDKHKIYGRYKMDHGSQPTSTSVIDPLFSAVSIQPEYEGQFNDSYVISPTKTNVFVAAANWYSAYFGPVNPAASEAELPVDMYYTDDGLDGSGVNAAPGLPGIGVPFYLTQGRNVAQYQLEDDFSWIHNKHTLKLGANFRRDLVSDYDAQINVIFPYTVQLSLGDFASGEINQPNSLWGGSGYESWNQAYTSAPTAHLALYNIGMYFQDEWQALPNLKLTLGARVDRTGDPLCHNNCFSAYEGGFPLSSASLTTPYILSSGGSINPSNAHPFPKVEWGNFQPRFGANYSFSSRTEIRGGVGLFSDLYPAGFLDGVIQNFPNYNGVSVFSGAVGTSGTGTSGAFASAVNSSVQSGFTSGQGTSAINNALYAQGVPFAPPSLGAYFPGEFKVPEYLEYSLQLQHQLTNHDAVVVTYAGNFGYRGVLINKDLNASSGAFANSATGGSWSQVAPFGGLPATPPDPRFSVVAAYTNDGHSNYNGGMVSFKHNGHGITGQVSYTYSHSLDLVSNGGEGENFNGGSVTTQLTPSLGTQNLNYSNSDYDIRNNLVGDLVYEEPFKASNKILDEVAGGWVLGAKTYYRGGEPFSIINGGVLGSFHTLSGTLMPDLASGVTRSQIVNPSGSNPHSCVNASCLQVSQFGAYGGQADFGDLRRNAIYGPHYVNTDLSVLKKIVKAEGLTLEIGANAYNVFNHANFAPPVNDISSGAFGLITGAVAPPTSPYGSFQGAAVTQRLLQVHGKITF